MSQTIDWSNDEAVVRAAVPNIFVNMRNEIGIWEPKKVGIMQKFIWFGETWKEARSHELVRAFERQHRPADSTDPKPSPPPVNDCPLCAAKGRAECIGGAHRNAMAEDGVIGKPTPPEEQPPECLCDEYGTELCSMRKQNCVACGQPLRNIYVEVP